MVGVWLGQRCGTTSSPITRPLEQHRGRDEEGFGDLKEVVDVAAALDAFAGQHPVGQWMAEGRQPCGQLALNDAPFCAEEFDGSDGS